MSGERPDQGLRWRVAVGQAAGFGGTLVYRGEEKSPGLFSPETEFFTVERGYAGRVADALNALAKARPDQGLIQELAYEALRAALEPLEVAASYAHAPEATVGVQIHGRECAKVVPLVRDALHALAADALASRPTEAQEPGPRAPQGETESICAACADKDAKIARLLGGDYTPEEIATVQIRELLAIASKWRLEAEDRDAHAKAAANELFAWRDWADGILDEVFADDAEARSRIDQRLRALSAASVPQGEERVRELLRQAKPVHYPGECGHCGIDEESPETCPTLAFIRQIDDALAATEAAPQGWQPIATAPKDGPVLVTAGGVIWIAPHPLMAKARGKATHWLPLPTPPATGEEG